MQYLLYGGGFAAGVLYGVVARNGVAVGCGAIVIPIVVGMFAGSALGGVRGDGAWVLAFLIIAGAKVLALWLVGTLAGWMIAKILWPNRI